MARKPLNLHWTLALGLLLGCNTKKPGIGAFDGPSASAVLDPSDGGPFEEPVGFVANTRRGTVVPIDLKNASLLGDQYGGPTLRPRWVAAGDQRQLGQIAVWAPTDESVTVYAADLAWDQLLEIPYIVSMEGGEPQVVEPTAEGPTFVDADASGDGATIDDLALSPGYTTTEDWTIEYDGSRWWVEGSRSGRQSENVVAGEAWRSDNHELEFTLNGTATEGDRFDLHTDNGLVEHDLGGPILGMTRVPGESVLLCAVWDPFAEQGRIVAWDAATASVVGEIALPEGAQPYRFAFGADPTQVFVGDARAPAVYEIGLDLADPAASTLSTLQTAGPVQSLTYLEDDGGVFEDDDVYRHLVVGLAYENRVDVWDLDAQDWLDVNPLDEVVGGLDLESPVVGLASGPDRIKLQALSPSGVRLESKVVAATLFDGSIIMFEGGTGCLVIDEEGARVSTSTSGTTSDPWTDWGEGSNPLMLQDTYTGRSITTPSCGGIAHSETWSLTYDGVVGNWRVEGSRSGEQVGRAWEDERYISDDGSISFLILAGSLPTTDGDSYQFSVQDGVLRIDNIPSGKDTQPLELPGPPVTFQYLAGPTGGGWDQVDRRTFVLVPITNSDVTLRVRLQAWQVEVIWN